MVYDSFTGTVGSSVNYVGPLPTPTITDSNGFTSNVFNIDFGTFGVDPGAAADRRITLLVVGHVVDNSPTDTVAGNTLTGTATATYSAGVTEVATVDVEVVEPVLDLIVSQDANSGDYGDVVTFTVEVDNIASSTQEAFDIDVQVTVPAFFENIMLVSNTAGSIFSETSNVITITAPSLDKDASITVEYSASVAQTAIPSETDSTDFVLTWESVDNANARTSASDLRFRYYYSNFCINTFKYQCSKYRRVQYYNW